MKNQPHFREDGSLHSGGTHKMNGELHSGSKHSKSSVRLFHIDELAGDPKKKALGLLERIGK